MTEGLQALLCRREHTQHDRQVEQTALAVNIQQATFEWSPIDEQQDARKPDAAKQDKKSSKRKNNKENVKEEIKQFSEKKNEEIESDRDAEHGTRIIYLMFYYLV